MPQVHIVLTQCVHSSLVRICILGALAGFSLVSTNVSHGLMQCRTRNYTIRNATQATLTCTCAAETMMAVAFEEKMNALKLVPGPNGNAQLVSEPYLQVHSTPQLKKLLLESSPTLAQDSADVLTAPD